MNRKKLLKAYNAARAAMQAASQAIDNADDAADLDDLQRTFDEALDEVKRCKANLDAFDARSAAASEFGEIEDSELEGRASERTPGQVVDLTDVRVGAEPLTYRADNAHERSFFADMFRAQRSSDPEAGQRLSRHRQEMADLAPTQRAVGTGAFSGLVVPQYLVELYAPIARAGRPFANRCRPLPLPAEGMTFQISRLTTGTSVDIQETENTAVSNTDADDTLLTINVRTIAGQQDVSRQLLERGTPGMDTLLYQDLLEAYATKVDYQVVNGSGSNGQLKGVLQSSGIETVTYTDDTPTFPEFYPKIADAIQRVASGRFAGADTVALASRRWGWCTAALDSQNRPFVLPTANGPSNAAGAVDSTGYGFGVGQLQGLPVLTDGNIPVNLGAGTNQDVAIVARFFDYLLWEEGDGTPRQVRFEETKGDQLTVKLVVYGYAGFTAERYPKSTSVITGTGLITPTF